MRMFCIPPPIAVPCPGSMSSVPRSCWLLPLANVNARSPLGSNVMKPRCGGLANGIARMAWRACSVMAGKAIRAIRSKSLPCNEHKSLNSPAWSRLPKGCTSRIGPVRTWPARPSTTKSSLRSARQQFGVSCTTSICSPIELGIGRRLGWTPGSERAEQVLWCYGNAARLAEQGIWVVCVDEIPTFQVLQRPIRRGIPGSIEQQEFDYTRHGTANLLVFLVVHSGLMELAFLAKNDAAHYLPELQLFRKHHKELRGIFLVQDGGPSHIAGGTQRYFGESKGWWKHRFTPANASWLNQAEILIHVFKHYYLKRASWKTQEEFRTHVMASWPEYNHRYAHPFEWTWTDQKMHQWFAKHASNSLQVL